MVFDSFIHFTASPADIAAIIKSKGLTEVPDEMPDKGDSSTYFVRQKSKDPHGWWQPAEMSNPKFYYRAHERPGMQGWDERWWVNDATNEVYANIGG